MVCSRINISHLLPCAEYSANNSFNYNGNNGKLNNNNKNNTYSVRPVLELGRLQTYFEDCPFPLSEIYDIYRITKKHKASKPSHLLFQLYYPQYLRSLWQDINNCHYRPSSSIAFIITKPKVREVIAADFRDRVVQNLLVQEMLPSLEEYEHPHSYSCRKGKGCLAAVQRLQASKWAQIFRFPVGYEKVEIKASKSKMEHYRRLNKVRYRQQLSISNAI